MFIFENNIYQNPWISYNLIISSFLIIFTGLSNSVFMVGSMSLLQMKVPDNLRGRVMGIHTITFSLMSAGALFLGLIAELLSSSISGEEINFLDLSNLYSKQLLYALISIFLGFIAISIEVKFYERFSSIFYLISLIVLLCLFLFGKRVNGALSWFPIAGFNLQPSEFVKITVALAVSKYISDFQTDLKKTNDQLKLFLIIFIPIIIIAVSYTHLRAHET